MKGNCTSRRAHAVTGCSGICESTAKAEFGPDGYKPMCSCCKPVEFSNKLVQMTCSDGKEPYEVAFYFFVDIRKQG